MRYRQKLLATVLGAVYALSSLFCLCPHALAHAANAHAASTSHHTQHDAAGAHGCCDPAKHDADGHASGEHRDGCSHCDGAKVLLAKANDLDTVQLAAPQPISIPLDRWTEPTLLLRSTTSRAADPPGGCWTPGPRMVLLRKSTLLI